MDLGTYIAGYKKSYQMRTNLPKKFLSRLRREMNRINIFEGIDAIRWIRFATEYDDGLYSKK